ncbi:MAG: DUF445 family protein [Myxococcales bacterium]
MNSPSLDFTLEAPAAAQDASAARERPPHLARSRISLALLLGAAGGMLFAAVMAHSWPGTLWEILVHGFEGALVGGLCDWFAVAKTYRTVEDNKDAVATSIGDWVSGELLNQEVIRSRLDALIDDPQVHERLCRAIDRSLGSAQQTREVVASSWKTVEGKIVELAAGYQLRDADLGAGQALFKDDTIATVVSRCVGEALLEVAASNELVAFVEEARGRLPWLAKLAVSAPAIQNKLWEQGERLRDGVCAEESDALPTRVRGLAEFAANAYVRAWNKLSDVERRAASEALVRHLREPIFDAVTHLIGAEREKLRSFHQLRQYPPVASLVQGAQQFVNQDLSLSVGRAVSSSLRELPARSFRQNLESRTRSYLELIRINGTLLGFAIGSFMGVCLSSLASR